MSEQEKANKWWLKLSDEETIRMSDKYSLKEFYSESDILFIYQQEHQQPSADYDDYIVTTEDSEENHFVNPDSKESAINIYKSWSKGESVMAKNTKIYKAIDITDEVQKAQTYLYEISLEFCGAKQEHQQPLNKFSLLKESNVVAADSTTFIEQPTTDLMQELDKEAENALNKEFNTAFDLQMEITLNQSVERIKKAMKELATSPIAVKIHNAKIVEVIEEKIKEYEFEINSEKMNHFTFAELSGKIEALQELVKTINNEH